MAKEYKVCKGCRCTYSAELVAVDYFQSKSSSVLPAGYHKLCGLCVAYASNIHHGITHIPNVNPFSGTVARNNWEGAYKINGKNWKWILTPVV